MADNLISSSDEDGIFAELKIFTDTSEESRAAVRDESAKVVNFWRFPKWYPAWALRSYERFLSSMFRELQNDVGFTSITYLVRGEKPNLVTELRKRIDATKESLTSPEPWDFSLLESISGIDLLEHQVLFHLAEHEVASELSEQQGLAYLTDDDFASDVVRRGPSPDVYLAGAQKAKEIAENRKSDLKTSLKKLAQTDRSYLSTTPAGVRRTAAKLRREEFQHWPGNNGRTLREKIEEIVPDVETELQRRDATYTRNQ